MLAIRRGEKSGAGRRSRTSSNREHGANATQILLTGTNGVFNVNLKSLQRKSKKSKRKSKKSKRKSKKAFNAINTLREKAGSV